jgi:hypothetical protein
MGYQETNYMNQKLKYFVMYVPYKLFPLATGRFIYYRKFGKILNADNLVTFNDKIKWMCLNGVHRNRLMVLCTDKYLVREYVKSKGYVDYLNELIGVWDSPRDIDWDSLPERFALKCNHGCGSNIICADKRKLDISQAGKTLLTWMKIDYGAFGVEPHYGKIKRRIICEKYISDGVGAYPVDYKFYCFNGVPKLMLVITGRAEDQMRFNVVDIDYKPMTNFFINEEHIMPKPKCFQEMLECAESLAGDFCFVRVDFYVVDDKPVFGELTFVPGAGQSNYLTKNGDLVMGSWLNI